jgi:hypothetical protein
MTITEIPPVRKFNIEFTENQLKNLAVLLGGISVNYHKGKIENKVYVQIFGPVTYENLNLYDAIKDLFYKD